MADEAAASAKSIARKTIYESKLFRGLSEAGRTELVARAHTKSYAQNETVFLVGESGDRLIVVVDGRLKVSVASPDGKELVLALLGPGEILGEIAVLDGKERTANVTAQTKATLALIERRDILALLSREPAAWLPIVEMLCARLRSTDQQIAEIALFDLPTRLASVLLRMGAPDKAAAKKPRVAISQRELGEMVGASREAVNKCLATWQRAGVVRIDGASIAITNEAALRHAAEGD